jgi:hypothetical protein
MFCLSFFFWPLCCLSFFELHILITPLVSSNSSNRVLFDCYDHSHIVLNYISIFQFVQKVQWSQIHQNLQPHVSTLINIKKEVKIMVSDKSIIMLQVAQKCQQGNLDVSIITYIFVYKWIISFAKLLFQNNPECYGVSKFRNDISFIINSKI